MNHLYLCGFMGCGKSTVGKQLAKGLGTRFLDLDDYIVEKAGKSIPEIFASQGEEAFRDWETKCLSELSQKPRMVIATGGGTLMRPQNVQAAKESGKIVFLDIPFAECYRRIKGDENRPVAARSTLEELEALYNTRREVYRSVCDLSVEQILSPLKTAELIIQRVKSLG